MKDLRLRHSIQAAVTYARNHGRNALLKFRHAFRRGRRITEEEEQFVGIKPALEPQCPTSLLHLPNSAEISRVRRIRWMPRQAVNLRRPSRPDGILHVGPEDVFPSIWTTT